MAETPGVTPALLVALGENGVTTLDGLADLASDELLEIAPAGTLGEDKANDIIMAARAHWFEDESAAADPTAGAEAATIPSEGTADGDVGA